MDRRTVVSTVGVIVLGAVGSGVWELAKPVLALLWEASITLSTLGLDSLRDGLYAAAAAGVVKTVANTAPTLLVNAHTSVLAAAVLHSVGLSLPAQDKKTVQIYFWLTVWLALALLVAASRMAYIGKLTSDYLKLETIAAPHLSDAEYKRRRAALALVEDREQFIEQVRSLVATVEAAGQKVPAQDFF